MSKIFISHSKIDYDEVIKFIDFLVLGMGINRDEIFYSSKNTSFDSGQFFIEKIKTELNNCEKVICFITSNYLNSKFCLAEMGAAWIQVGKIIPVLSPPLTHTDLENTPLLGLQVRYQNNAEDMVTLYDEFCRSNIAKSGETSNLNRCLKKYLEEKSNTSLIEKDVNGYYTAEITKIRHTPSSFKCYKLNKPLNLQIGSEENETHWLFFKTGMYKECNVGETVKIMVDNTELRYFPDLKNARNIYPKDLKII